VTAFPTDEEKRVITPLARLAQDEDGQDLIEYGLLAALISIVAVLAIGQLGEKVLSAYESINTRIP
jgi:Flp pilus assembly pilin Flp